MRPIQRIISVGFATAAVASASLPALSFHEWHPDGLTWVVPEAKAATPAAAPVTPVRPADAAAPEAAPEISDRR